MAPLDAIFVAILAVSLGLGLLRGFAYEAVSLSAWLAAYAVAHELAPEVAGALSPALPDAPELVHYGAAFCLVCIGVGLAGNVPAWLAHKVIESMGLRAIDRVVGALLGVARGALLLLAVAVAVNLTPLRFQPWWISAAGSTVTAVALSHLKPVLPEELAQYLP